MSATKGRSQQEQGKGENEKREERRPLHVRLTRDERRQLNRVATRLGLSPSAAIRHLVHIEDEQANGVSLAMLGTYPALWRDD